MKKSIISLLTVTLTAITLSGCALAPVPDMTEEQEKLVAEYAAGLLLKYDQSYDNQIMTPEQLEKAKEKERIQKERDEKTRILAQQYLEKTKAAENNKSKKKSSEKSDDTKKEENKGPEAITGSAIGTFLGTDGLEISYDGFKTVKSYPETGNNVFSVDAANGNELVVANIKVSNQSSDAIDIDMFSRDVVFYLDLADGSKIPCCSTLLLDDFSIYKDQISAGTSVGTILLFETAQGVSLDGASIGIMDGTKQATFMMN